MANAASILLKVNKALNKVGPLERLLYKRLVITSGDALIGRTMSVNTDTLLNPQPVISHAGRQHLSGQRDAVETIISPSGERTVRDDYIITISASSISEDELHNQNIYFVFKNGTDEEVLFVMDYSPIEFQGTEIVYQLYARSVKST